MTEKRFTVHIVFYNPEKTEGEIELKDNGQPLLISESIDDVRHLKDLLNKLHNENNQLKQELKVYRKVASCSNCHYHNYDWYDDGDEFEVCDMGNTERLMYHRFCKDWKRG